MKKLLLFNVFLFGCGLAQGQVKKMDYRNRVGDTVVFVDTQIKPPKEKPIKPLRKEYAVGFRANTDGWNAYFNYGFIRNNEGDKQEIDRFFNVLFLQLEIGEKKHPKEHRSVVYNPTNPTPNNLLSSFNINNLVYGKLNTFYQAKLGVGYKKWIVGKPEPNTVSIYWTTSGGFSLGLLKPYIFTTKGSGDIIIDPEKAGSILARTQFTGAYGIRKGWNKLSFVPGLHLKTGLTFDYTNRKKRLGAVEIGVGMEYYFSDIHQMALQPPKKLFLNAYAAFEIGWRRQ